MPRTLVLLLYNLLYPLALLLMAPGAWKKMRARGGKAGDLWQRFGFFHGEEKDRLAAWQSGDGVMWIHAVSVGEVGIAAKLIRELLKRRPALRFVLTSTTPTGFALARQCALDNGGAVLPLYSALDGWFTVRRFLRAIQPRQLVLVEAEVWPNLVFAAKRRCIPVTLVNARLSPRSERRFRALRFLAEPVFSMLTRVCVQEPEDVARFAGSFGIAPQSVTCAGSIKFDIAGDVEPVEQIGQFRGLIAGLGWQPADPIVLAASTHAGEEGALAQVFRNLQATVPALRLILVPRHVERAAKIEEELSHSGHHVTLRSRLGMTHHEPTGMNHDILLVDTTGELRAWQHLVTVVVIGKSFLAAGGQNPAEASMAGKPVVFGPHMENFEALVRLLLSKNGAVRVPDFAELEAKLLWLLQDVTAAREIGHAGQQSLQAHAGSTRRTADCLLA